MEFTKGNSKGDKRSGDGVKVISVEEKPKTSKSNYSIVGLYFYPADVSQKAEQVKPSARGELEITTLNDMYIQEERLQALLLGRGFTWIDAGTFYSLRKATNFVCMIEEYQGITISSQRRSLTTWGIDDEKLRLNAKQYGKSPYGEHLMAVLEGKVAL